jgi:hypothetical protein
MSTDLVQLGAQPEYDTMLETGLDSVARLTPTNLILVQNSTRDPKGARPGQILDDLTEEVFDRITVVPLKVWTSRVLFPPGADLDTDPLCKSDNGVVPSDYSQQKQALQCRICPQNDWSDGRAACKEKINFLTVVKDGAIAGLPRFFSAGGMSISAIKYQLKRIRQNIEILKRKGTKVELYDFYFDITSERKTGSKGAYYVVRIENLKMNPNPSEFGPMFEEFVLAAKRQAHERQQLLAEASVNGAVNNAIDGEVIDAEVVTEV